MTSEEDGRFESSRRKNGMRIYTFDTGSRTQVLPSSFDALYAMDKNEKGRNRIFVFNAHSFQECKKMFH